ncbi:MAG: DNA methyltransferase [Candidatus Krumholzibacteriota bacterium]|nr:DNA methyltransferase [Candidatus Krumholzibacteriota bacterium]
MSRSKENNKQKPLFKTKIVPGKPGSQNLFEEEFIRDEGLVECLGMTFENDKKRRQHFLEILKEKLKDPEFRKIEGFPLGEDEDILNLSDPPYYTACPNPWIGGFIKLWESQKPERDNKKYHREPFVADVSEGKNDPIYNAHSYHTKVPHKAIMRYILHYTAPGDIVFDGFCGTGMTGVAAQMCGNKDAVESLGVTKKSPEKKYRVEKDGTISEKKVNEGGKTVWTPFSKIGARKAVLNDLSPAATFIAYNYNTPVDVVEFEREAKRILKEVEEECGWMYETAHEDGQKGRINYTVWSDVFVCPECSGEIIFSEAAVDKEAGKVHKEFPCPHCQVQLTKRKMDRAWVTKYDSALNKSIRQAKQVPVLINYSLPVPDRKRPKRFKKTPEESDLALIERIENSEIPYWFPADRMMEGEETRRNDRFGITHVHHFYTKRNLWVLGAVLNMCSLKIRLLFQSLSQFVQQADNNPLLLFLFGSALPKLTIMNRYMPQHGGRALVGPMANTLYVPPVCVEKNVIDQFRFQFNKIAKALNSLKSNLVLTQAAQQINVPDNSIDYLFLDPPFGANIMYSELSFIREAWLKVFTNSKPEAIENKSQKKTIDVYRILMAECFKETYRMLKPGHWMTVEFSNTKSSVWNSIQRALSEAGFIVASVAALDKTRGGLHAMIGPTAVKQDLVISAYKPNGGFVERFLKEASTEEGVWDFIRTHLGYLPVIKKQGNELVPVPERDPRILFDQVVAFYVSKGYRVPVSSPEFQKGLAERFSLRDGMYFLPEQTAEYDKKRMNAKEIIQLNLFVSDEATSIQWLKQILNKKPLTFQDINPQFLKEISGWDKHEKALELSEILEQNFLRYDGKSNVPSQIHSYLSSNFKELRNLEKDDPALIAKAKDRWYVPDPRKASDLEQLRTRVLMREFKEYVEYKKKRIRVFRMEAVRAGFKKAWQERDYTTIIDVAQKIPDKIIQEDPKLLMWYDQAVTRTGEE